MTIPHVFLAGFLNIKYLKGAGVGVSGFLDPGVPFVDLEVPFDTSAVRNPQWVPSSVRISHVSCDIMTFLGFSCSQVSQDIMISHDFPDKSSLNYRLMWELHGPGSVLGRVQA